MKRRFLTAGVLALLVTTGGGTASAAGGRADRISGVLLINPHEEPARCVSCHVRVPDEAEARAGLYQLHGPSIDETCAMCHGSICCEPSAKHLSHPTGIDSWNAPGFRRPKTLPLFDGFITCTTCHYFRERDGKRELRLLRIARIKDNGNLDWDALCKDCHTDY